MSALPTWCLAVPHEGGVVAFFPEAGVVGFAPSPEDVQDLRRAAIQRVAASATEPVQGHARVVRRVSLILTKDCPLRCRYCYAEGGAKRTTMPEGLATHAIREGAKGSPEILYVTFFGGEPTLCMSTIRSSVAAARSLVPRCHFHISTGGVASEEDLAFLITNAFTVSVSTDGPPDIQNRQRPLAGDKPSAPLVERTIRELVLAGAAFKVRCTVTTLNVHRLAECVEYWAAMGVRYVHFEPINVAGRAAQGGMGLPDPDEYIANFISAVDVAQARSVGIINSAYMYLRSPTPCYCTTVAGDKLMVAPDGAVTLCYEVQECDHPLSDFVIGRYDSERGEFVLDREKQARLYRLSVESYQECRDCFAKYVCAGGCPNRNLVATGRITTVSPWLCKVKKALIHDAVIRIYRSSRERARTLPAEVLGVIVESVAEGGQT